MAKRSPSLADDIEYPQPQEQQEQLQHMPHHCGPGVYCAICQVYYPSDLNFYAHLLRDQHETKLKWATDYEPERIALFNDLMRRLQREEEDARVAATFASGDGARTS